MNSNGIREWIAQAGRSQYRTPRMSWWTWLAIGIVIGMLVGSPAHASPGCMTAREARHAYPDRHLWWSSDGDGGRCWTTVRGGRHVAARRGNEKSIRSSQSKLEGRHNRNSGILSQEQSDVSAPTPRKTLSSQSGSDSDSARENVSLTVQPMRKSKEPCSSLSGVRETIGCSVAMQGTSRSPPQEIEAGVASGPPETEASPSASMIEAAAAALGPAEIILPSSIDVAFADRWPETQPTISPLRWSRELVEFGSAAP